MHFFKIFYFKILKYDLINKFKYKNIIELVKFKSIILNLNSKIVNVKQLSSKLLAIELITHQKGYLLFVKNLITTFKIRKINPTSCKLIVKKNNLFRIIGKLAIKIFPKFKNSNNYEFYFKIQKTKFFYNIKNIFTFSELENYYYYFNNLPKLYIIMSFYSRNKKEFIFIMKSFKFPFNTKS